MPRRLLFVVFLFGTLVLQLSTHKLFAQQTATEPNDPPPTAKAPFDATQAQQHQAAWAKYLDVPVAQRNTLGTNIILIPPGEFLMGSSEQQVAAALQLAVELQIDDNTQKRIRVVERPQHQMKIAQPFYLAATEVTLAEFRKFVDATGYRTQAEEIGSANSASAQKPADGTGDKFDWRFPGFKQQEAAAVSQVTWNDAAAFCNWLSEQESLTPAYRSEEKQVWILVPNATGYRLPTEAEWEYAARAGSNTQFHFGDDPGILSDYAWFGFKSGSDPKRVVGAKLPNAFGLHDMHGNIGEWCQDFYKPTSYPKHHVTEVSSAEPNTRRVVRGGDWWGNALRCRAAFRGYGDQVTRSDDLGFRVARSK